MWRGLLLIALAGVIWGTIGPAVQLVHDGSGLAPSTISAYRAVVAVTALVLVTVATRRFRTSWVLARREWRRVVVIGLLTAAFQLLFFVAVVATGVSVATVVCLGSAPVLLLVLGGVQRRRLPAAGRIVTVLVALVGLVLVSVAGGIERHAPNPTLGILAALASGAAYAFSADISAALSQRLDILTVTVATISVAGAVLIPGGLAWAHLRGDALTTTNGSSWLLIAYLGLVTMTVAYALMYTGLRTTPSGTAVVATLIEPVTALLIAVLVLGEHLSPAGLVGAVLIVAAIGGLGRTDGEPLPQ